MNAKDFLRLCASQHEVNFGMVPFPKSQSVGLLPTSIPRLTNRGSHLSLRGLWNTDFLAVQDLEFRC